MWTTADQYREILSKMMIKMMRDVLTTPKYQFPNIIIHGRFVRSKVMFKYDASYKPCDAKIVDWQAVTINSPGVDFARIFLSNLPDDDDFQPFELFFQKMCLIYLGNVRYMNWKKRNLLRH